MALIAIAAVGPSAAPALGQTLALPAGRNAIAVAPEVEFRGPGARAAS